LHLSSVLLLLGLLLLLTLPLLMLRSLLGAGLLRCLPPFLRLLLLLQLLTLCLLLFALALRLRSPLSPSLLRCLPPFRRRLSWLLLPLCRRLTSGRRGSPRFSFLWLRCSSCAGGSFSYPGPLRFPLLYSLTFLLAGWRPCNALALAPRCPAGPRSLRSLLSTFTLNSLFSGLEALGLRTLFCPLRALLSLGREASLPCLLERLTRPHASLTCHSPRVSSSAPLSFSSGFARGCCAALLSGARSWSRSLTTLCRWWSCQTFCWICRTGAGPSSSSWLTS
jgi:hypothetical protein